MKLQSAKCYNKNPCQYEKKHIEISVVALLFIIYATAWLGYHLSIMDNLHRLTICIIYNKYLSTVFISFLGDCP